MEVECFKVKVYSPEEVQEFEKLRVVIEVSTSAGKIDRYAIKRIKGIVLANKNVISEKLHLYRILILDKIECGKLEYDWW